MKNNKRICIRNQKVKLQQYFIQIFNILLFVTEANLLDTILLVILGNSMNCGGMSKLGAEM